MNISLQLQQSLEFKPLTHSQQILDFLTNPVGTKISTWVAYEKFHITCLAQRIYDLKIEIKRLHGFENFVIKSEMVYKNNKHFTEYWLERIL